MDPRSKNQAPFQNRTYPRLRSQCDSSNSSSPMKNPLIIAIVCIALGFAAGWIAKPDPTPEPKVASVDSSDKKPTRTITKSPSDNPAPSRERKTTLTSRVYTPGQVGEETNPEAEAAMNNWSKIMKDKQKAKSDARIAVLVDKLNLTPAQEAQLRAAMEKQLEAMGNIFDPSAGGGAKSPKDIASLLTGDGLDDTLSDILTPEQEGEYDALKKRERDNKIEASALKNLAKLSFLDMSQEQKDAAYDILYSQAETSVDKKSPGSAMMSIVTSGMGIELDADDLGVSGIVDAQFSGEAGTTEPGDIMARMKESQAKKVDEKIEALRPVLDEKQLEQYRNHLESNSSGLLGGFIGNSIEVEVAPPAKKE